MSSAIHYTLFQTNLNVQSFMYTWARATNGGHGFSAKWFAIRAIFGCTLNKWTLPQTQRTTFSDGICGPIAAQKKIVVNVIRYCVYSRSGSSIMPNVTCPAIECDRNSCSRRNCITAKNQLNYFCCVKYNTSFATYTPYNAPDREETTLRRYKQKQQQQHTHTHAIIMMAEAITDNDAEE